MSWEWILIGIAALLFFLVLLRFLKFFYNILFPYVLLSPIDLRKRAGASWAVITGSTDGIGKSYAFELASRGFNIFLVSRTQSKLDATKQEILDEHPHIQLRTAAYDFTNASVSGYRDLLALLNEVDVGILINNVGMFYDCPDEMHKQDIEELTNMVTVNTLPPTLLTAGILPQMLSRGTGVIVNIGSSSSANQMPFLAAYSSSKKYVEWLSATLRKEYAHQGITIQTITPMFVATKMSSLGGSSFFAPDAPTYARPAVNTIGNTTETTGYIAHQLQYEGMNLLPQFIVDVFVKEASIRMRDLAMARKYKEKK